MQLHRKYATDGLVVMSLDVDQLEWEKKEKVLKFLSDQDAKFPNYIFRDRPQRVDDWLEKYDAASTPALVVFDRAGQRVRVPDLKTVDEQEAFVKQVLAR